MSKCPNCGGDLNYNVKDTVVKCEYCGSTFNPKELDLKTKYVKETETFEGKSFNCTQCGAQLLAFDEREKLVNVNDTWVSIIFSVFILNIKIFFVILLIMKIN